MLPGQTLNLVAEGRSYVSINHFKIFLAGLLLLFSPSLLYAQQATASLRDKIAQMLMMGFSENQLSPQSEVVQWIQHDHIGGVIAFDINESDQSLNKNIKNKNQIHELNKQLQFYTKKALRKAHLPALPLLTAIDYEGGWVDRLKAADGFEPTLPPALFRKLSKTKLKHELNKMSHYLKVAGFNLDLAPIIDVEVNPTNPIIAAYKRSYSPNPEEVAYYAGKYVEALRAQNIQCAFKHFPGHGSSTTDSHLGFVDVTNTWKSYELLPYQLLIMEKPTCGVVMSAHIVNRQLDPSGLPATLSHTMLTKLLRQHLHFQGVIMSDDMQMKAITEHYTLEQAVVLAINAGIDILLFANQKEIKVTPKALIDLIERKVKDGSIPLHRIDDAYKKIQHLKQGLGSR